MDTGVILVEAPRGRLFLPPETFVFFTRVCASFSATRSENGDGLFSH